MMIPRNSGMRHGTTNGMFPEQDDGLEDTMQRVAALGKLLELTQMSFSLDQQQKQQASALEGIGYFSKLDPTAKDYDDKFNDGIRNFHDAFGDTAFGHVFDAKNAERQQYKNAQTAAAGNGFDGASKAAFNEAQTLFPGNYDAQISYAQGVQKKEQGILEAFGKGLVSRDEIAGYTNGGAYDLSKFHGLADNVTARSAQYDQSQQAYKDALSAKASDLKQKHEDYLESHQKESDVFNSALLKNGGEAPDAETPDGTPTSKPGGLVIPGAKAQPDAALSDNDKLIRSVESGDYLKDIRNLDVSGKAPAAERPKIDGALASMDASKGAAPVAAPASATAPSATPLNNATAQQ